MKRSVRQLTNKKIPSALPLVWKVFDEYEAVNYPTSGTQAFWNAIHDEGSHIALFFVDGAYHRQGVGRLLWDTFPAESDKDEITVNSSLYAVGIYEKLGFIKTAEAQTESGIQFVPMVFKKPKTEERK